MNEAITKSDVFLIRIFQSIYIGYTVTKSLRYVFFRVYLEQEQMKTPYLSNYICNSEMPISITISLSYATYFCSFLVYR